MAIQNPVTFFHAFALGFVKIRKAGDGDSYEEIVQNLTQGFSELQKIRKGTIKTTPAKDFLNELQD